MKSDARISVRISTTELEDIDDFIARHPEFRNRSEFLRIAALKYKELIDKNSNITVGKTSKTAGEIDNVSSEKEIDEQENDENYILIRIPKDINYRNLSELIELGIFPTIDDAFIELYYYIVHKNIITEFIGQKVSSITQVERDKDVLRQILENRGSLKGKKNAKVPRWDE